MFSCVYSISVSQQCKSSRISGTELVLSARHRLKNFWSVNLAFLIVLGNRFYQPHFPGGTQALEIEVVCVWQHNDSRSETWIWAVFLYNLAPSCHILPCHFSCSHLFREVLRRSIHHLTLSLFLSWLGHSCCFSNSYSCETHVCPTFLPSSSDFSLLSSFSVLGIF